MEKGWAQLGRAIRARRRAAGLSQEELAERSGTHWTYISEIENNRQNPSINLVRRIASGLGIRLSELVTDAEEVDDRS